jgi:hypothetical protein
MSASVSANTMSLMSSFGFDLAQLNSTDLLVELVIDTFDQWSIPAGPLEPATSCFSGNYFHSAAALV